MINSYTRMRRSVLPSIEFNTFTIDRISDILGKRNKSDLSPFRNIVFILNWSVGGSFGAEVLGDDACGIPIVFFSKVEDDKLRDVQEFLLYEWLRKFGKYDKILEGIRGRTAFLTYARRGSNVFTVNDVVVFSNFGVFDDAKMRNINDVLREFR